MKNKIFILLILFCFTKIFAQKEAANWYFGEFGGLDFNSGIPVGQKGKMATREGCASISNKNGMLLFYTNGKEVWDKNHNIMPNGYGLLGHNSSTQSAIIVPKPGSNSRYYVFTVDNAETSEANEIEQGLTYSEIDINLNNGLGDVIASSKNRHLITYDSNNSLQKTWKCSEKIAAVISEDESFYWVITHFVDTFYAFKINNNGVVETPVTTKVNEIIDIVDVLKTGYGKINVSALGYLKISPDGKKIAIAHSSTANTSNSGKVFLYNFNNSTGKVSTSGQLLLSGTYPYGVEFSPKSKVLYISANNYETIRGVTEFKSSQLYQYDLESSTVKSSEKIIDNSTVILAGALQLAIDGKIYRANYNQSNGKGAGHLAVINKPEQLGNASNYNENGVNLAAGSFSAYGLPPFIASYFLFTFDYDHTCLGDATHFFITSDEPYDSLIWDFGDGTTSVEDEPFHTFENPGVYTVTLTTKIGAEENEPLTKTVEIVDLVNVLETPYELIECDASDSNPTDGITTFNLTLANNPISLGNENFVDVYYYDNLNTLNNDIYNENALPNFYTNTASNQLIYAKVVKSGSDCFGVGQVILKTSESVEFTSESLTSCDLGNGTGEFNLIAKKSLIKSALNLSNNSTITYHKTRNDAAISYEPLEEIYNSNPTTIYIRVENENICYGIGSLDLKVFSFPEIDLKETYNICVDEFPFKINAAIDITNAQNYLFKWNTGGNSYEIEINDEGNYSVEIIDKINACSQTRNITVNTIKPAEIKNIEILNNSIKNTAIIEVRNNVADYLYSLDDEFGNYQPEPVFTDLIPGAYSVYIKDINNCHTIEKQFYIFGFPKFFTPNNDGYNDTWVIKGLNFDAFTYSNIEIFNRFGKHVATMKADSGWDGTYQTENLPSSDYWFTLTVTDSENNIKTYKGHFSLIRQ